MKSKEETIDEVLRRKFGDFVKKQRTKKGWSREAMASAFESQGFSISEQTIKSYEYGQRIPPLSKLMYICFLLGSKSEESFCKLLNEIFDEIKKSK